MNIQKLFTCTALCAAAFSASGCVALFGDDYSGFTGYTTDAGRCVHTIETSQNEDGTRTTTKTTTCEQEAAR